MKTKPGARPKLVCSECQEGLVHRLITLHAASDTVLVCEGAWKSLPSWLQEAHKGCAKLGLAKRREVVREIGEQLSG